MSSAATSTVISLESSRASPRIRTKNPKHPDAKLIDACIECATQMKAALIAYDIDPTEDAAHAALFSDLAYSRADRALQVATNIRPSTLDGIRAKARCAEILLQKRSDHLLDEIDIDFIASLAVDIARFHRPANEQNLYSTPEVVGGVR